MKTNAPIHWAAMNPDPYRGGRHKGGLGRVHAVHEYDTPNGPRISDYALCSQVAVPLGRQAFTDVPRDQRCKRCQKVMEGNIARLSEPGTSTVELEIHHEDPLIQEYLRALARGQLGGRGGSKRKSPETIKSYATTLGLCARWVHPTPWDAVEPDALSDFLRRPLGWPNSTTGEPITANTGKQNSSAIIGFYGYCNRRGHFDHNPTEWMGIPDLSEDTNEDAARPPVDPEVWKTAWGWRLMDPIDRLMLGLGYFTGLRRSEVVSIRPDVVAPGDERFRYFKRKGGKTKQGLQYGYCVKTLQRGLPELAKGAEEWIELLEWFSRYRAGFDTLVPVRTKNPGQWFRDRLMHAVFPGAGLPPDAFTPHQLRHSFGTNMILCGVLPEYLMDLMSHSRIETTMGYVDMTNQLGAWYERTSTTNETVDLDAIRRVRR